MHREQINVKEGICLLTIFIMGSTMILGIGGEAKNDAWIAGIAGILLAMPVIFIYARINSLFPEKEFYEILEITTGKTVSKILSMIYIWYSFHLGALVIRNFGEFMNTVTMPETPMIIPMLTLGITCIASVRAGIEVMSRITAYVLPLLLFIIATVQFLGISVLHFNYLKPVLGNGLTPILKGAFSAFSFPFAETVIFIGVFFSLKKETSFYKVYFSGLILAGVLIVMLTARNITVLGPMLGKLYFPSHVAVSRIKVGDFLERIEVTVATIFVFGVFIKAAVCLLVTCRCIAKLLRISDYRAIVIQVGLLMVYFSYLIYNNIMEMQFWAFKVYSYYAFPFQVIIPILLLLSAELKSREN